MHPFKTGEITLAAVKRKLEGLYDAIADGLRTAGLKERLEDLERKAATLEAALSAAPAAPVRLHPNLSEIYRRKVGDLANTLSDETLRGPAFETIRKLISSVSVLTTPEGITVQLDGAITAMLDLAQPGVSGHFGEGSVKVVAGAGLGLNRTRTVLPATATGFRL